MPKKVKKEEIHT